MPVLPEPILGLLLLMAGVGAAVLGFWIGSLSGPGKRLLMLVGALLLVAPVYSGLMFVTTGWPGTNVFMWWLIGLPWAAGPWCVAVGAGYLFGSLQRRARQ